MKVKITIITTAHYEDRGRETEVLVFTDDEPESVQIEALAECYGYSNDGGDYEPLPENPTWEWLEGEIGSYAWWNVDEREIVVDTRKPGV